MTRTIVGCVAGMALLGIFCREASALNRRAAAPAASADEEEAQRMFRQSVSLGVPESELSDLVRRCREAGFASVEIRRILSLVSKAKLAGLPHDDLLNKLREGLAKRAAPEAVERAVEAKAQALRRAKTLVDVLLSEGRTARNYSLALQVVADALDGGADPANVLQSVREGRRLAEGLPDVAAAFGKMQ